MYTLCRRVKTRQYTWGTPVRRQRSTRGARGPWVWDSRLRATIAPRTEAQWPQTYHKRNNYDESSLYFRFVIPPNGRGAPLFIYRKNEGLVWNYRYVLWSATHPEGHYGPYRESYKNIPPEYPDKTPMGMVEDVFPRGACLPTVVQFLSGDVIHAWPLRP